MNQKLKISKYLLLIAILSVFTILVYIAQIGYNKLMGQESNSKDIKSYEYEIINVNIDTKILEEIKQKQEFEAQSVQPIPPTPVDEFNQDVNQDQEFIYQPQEPDQIDNDI